MLDFVPNHMAPDHPWRDEHPDYFVHGSEDDLARTPQNYCRVQTKRGPLLLAYGRDPYFAGWPDTLQLNYGNPDLPQAMIGELERIAGQCDGERLLAAVNYAPNQSQCYVRLPFADLGAGEWRLQNQLEDVGYDRDGSALQSRGLYLDVPPW
jgi:glycosidase